MMLIKESDLLNFISCPIKYMVYKNNNINEPDTYNTLLHKSYKWTINDYNYNGLEGLDARIKKHWDKVCIQHQNEILPKKVIEGWGMLYRVYELLRDKHVEVLDVDIPYHIEIPGTSYAVEGQIDMISKYGDDIEILVPSFSNRMPESYLIDNNIKHSLDAYAIKKMFNKNTFITYHNYNISKDKYTARLERDLNKLELIVKNAGNCIENNLLYPCTGYHCSNCMARAICSEWGKDYNNEAF
jgi:hypothetical protein